MPSENLEVAHDASVSKTDLIQRMAGKALAAEIRAFIEMSEEDEWEEPHKVESAFDVIAELVEIGELPRLRRNVRQIQIACGYYREISDEEIARTYVTRAEAWDFTLDGKKYVFNSSQGGGK